MTSKAPQAAGASNIRRATPGDAEQLHRLNQLFDPGAEDKAPVHKVALALTGGGSEEVYVAHRGNHLLGFASVSVNWTFALTRPTAEVTALFVREDQRRQGIASKLLTALRQRAERLDVMEVFLRVNHTNAPALTCYEKNGWTKAMHHLYRIKYYGDA